LIDQSKAAPFAEGRETRERNMTQTLLVGVDGSEGSRRAAEFAATRAKLTGARLVIAFVIEWSPYTIYTHEELETRHRDREDEIRRAQTRILDPLASSLGSKGVEAETLVRHGHASRVLVDLAEELNTVQIYIGRRGHETLKELLFGSTVSNLVQASPVPVTVVP
jgi:nucleotide-binding universal stress UspA family protein